ncbi:predicted protein [Naegleria gruberi]|uniref:Protein YIF1 n=1 Tax=Naegleria gruberi TaxID=5762 RepID=D2V162_NAEGR|nr:uncharacterized protein NAEGRDRAFT_62771 [Naegleria gruberi]EFC49411.1 predicted protein [Naegleria gruberi]|eukprot:XP_002682155.1 predicted protein [Naegleria gruberi strain NEG-M]
MNDRRSALFDDVGSFPSSFDPTSPTPQQSLDFFDSGFSSRSIGGASSPQMMDNSSGAMDGSMNNQGMNAPGFGGLFGGFFGNNTSAGANLFQNPTADFMINMGVNQLYGSVGEKTNEVTSRYWQWFDGLKCYFNVTNSYVSRKLLLVLFPFKKFDTSYEYNNNNQNQTQERHLSDPDLYIPLMGYITYVLLVCFIMGAHKEFKPELLYSIGMKGFITSLLEIAIVKFGFYALGVQSSLGVLDVAAFSGYKYIGIIITLVLSLLFGNYAYYPSLLILGIMMVTFMIKSLRRSSVHSSDNSMRLRLDTNTAKRNYFIFIVAILQIPLFFFLTFSYAKPLFSIPGAAPLLDPTNIATPVQ